MASLILSVDAMGGDAAPTVVLDGLKLFAAERSNVMFEVHGRAEDITPGIESRGSGLTTMPSTSWVTR